MQHNGAILRTSALGLALALLVVGMLSASAVLATPIASGNGAAAGSVYTTTNDATANAILWYTRAANGMRVAWEAVLLLRSGCDARELVSKRLSC